ncbi:MAG: transposase [Candidatus Bipolaricaulia bacterium]
MDEDECWFSRFAQPQASAWAPDGDPLHLVQRDPPPKEEQKAIACFGGVRADTGQVYLYFCEGQPNSEHMIVFLKQLLDVAHREKKRVVVMIWDQASWHKSRRVRRWIKKYNWQAKQTGDVRLLPRLLPTQSPWLNPMEPRWIHAKRKVCEPDGELSVEELTGRLWAHFQTEPLGSALKE